MDASKVDQLAASNPRASGIVYEYGTAGMGRATTGSGLLSDFFLDV